MDELLKLIGETVLLGGGITGLIFFLLWFFEIASMAKRAITLLALCLAVLAAGLGFQVYTYYNPLPTNQVKDGIDLGYSTSTIFSSGEVACYNAPSIRP